MNVKEERNFRFAMCFGGQLTLRLGGYSELRGGVVVFSGDPTQTMFSINEHTDELLLQSAHNFTLSALSAVSPSKITSTEHGERRCFSLGACNCDEFRRILNQFEQPFLLQPVAIHASLYRSVPLPCRLAVGSMRRPKCGHVSVRLDLSGGHRPFDGSAHIPRIRLGVKGVVGDTCTGAEAAMTAQARYPRNAFGRRHIRTILDGPNSVSIMVLW